MSSTVMLSCPVFSESVDVKDFYIFICVSGVQSCSRYRCYAVLQSCIMHVFFISSDPSASGAFMADMCFFTKVEAVACTQMYTVYNHVQDTCMPCTCYLRCIEVGANSSVVLCCTFTG